MPQITVIVPVYNVEKYLNRCVDSILAQTFTDFELILVDDESPDNCGKICDEYSRKDNRVKVIHKSNGGVSTARNFGLDMAKGEYVTFCDSDDYVSNDWLEVMYNAIIEKQVDSIAINFSKVDDSGIEYGQTNKLQTKYVFETLEEKVKHISYDVLKGKTGWEAWTRLFKADLIRNNNLRFCETCENYAEDMAFVIEYIIVSNSTYVLEYSGYHYFLRSNSMMRTVKNSIKLNAMNEVSLHIYNFINKKYKFSLKKYTQIHCSVLYREYYKLCFSEKNNGLKNEITKIRNINWYKKMTWIVSCNYRYLKNYCKDENAAYTCILSRYCLHNNYFLFKLENSLYYRLFRKFGI